jgi:hypothetical protein
MATEFQFFPGLDYTLLRREDKEGDGAVNHLYAPEH